MEVKGTLAVSVAVVESVGTGDTSAVVVRMTVTVGVAVALGPSVGGTSSTAGIVAVTCAAGSGSGARTLSFARLGDREVAIVVVSAMYPLLSTAIA